MPGINLLPCEWQVVKFNCLPLPGSNPIDPRNTDNCVAAEDRSAQTIRTILGPYSAIMQIKQHLLCICCKVEEKPLSWIAADLLWVMALCASVSGNDQIAPNSVFSSLRLFTTLRTGTLSKDETG